MVHGVWCTWHMAHGEWRMFIALPSSCMHGGSCRAGMPVLRSRCFVACPDGRSICFEHMQLGCQHCFLDVWQQRDASCRILGSPYDSHACLDCLSGQQNSPLPIPRTPQLMYAPTNPSGYAMRSPDFNTGYSGYLPFIEKGQWPFKDVPESKSCTILVYVRESPDGPFILVRMEEAGAWSVSQRQFNSGCVKGHS